jgi:hypothetical protein
VETDGLTDRLFIDKLIAVMRYILLAVCVNLQADLFSKIFLAYNMCHH